MSHPAERSGALDIGDGHRVTFLVVDGDRHPEALPLLTATRRDDGTITAGIIEGHRNPAGEWCGGAVNFVQIDGRPVWTVESLDPLTISPSVLCNPDKGGCGSHGWIRGGKWASA